MKQDSSQKKYSEFSIVLCGERDRDAGSVMATAGDTESGHLLTFDALEPLVKFLMDQTRKGAQAREGDE